MSADRVAVVEAVGKCYQIYQKNIDRLKHSLRLGRRNPYREFWALRDISFEVKRGETLGIVGANGSGKSTLLQLLFGVLQPSEGRLHVNGKVGGLLELGGGFNPEETGRDNVLVNAAILGVRADEIPELLDKVVAFADIGDFLDQPIKVYSSGMTLRLGFALQINVPCETLIIDEALAVGDELFQRKCFAALEKFKDGGGTIFFVSHAAAAVKEFCERTLFLDHGRLVQQGPSRVVVENYQKFLYLREPKRSEFRDELMRAGELNDAPAAAEPKLGVFGDPAMNSSRPPTHPIVLDQGVDTSPPLAEYQEGIASQSRLCYEPAGARISNPRIETLDGEAVNVLNPHERYRYCYRVDFDEDAHEVVFGWLAKSTSGLELGGGAHGSSNSYLREAPAGSAYDVTFEFTASLYPGIYYLNCGVSGATAFYEGFLHRVIDAVAFRVRNVCFRTHAGFVDFNYRSTIRQSDERPGHDATTAEASLATAQ